MKPLTVLEPLVLAQGTVGETLAGPSLEWSRLTPVLVVLGVACIGVLVEAFAPRESRYGAQVVLVVLGLVAAFVSVVLQYDTAREIVAEGALAADGPALFLQGTVLVLALLAVLVVAERNLDPGGDAFTPRAAEVPGSAAEATLVRTRVQQTDVYPLIMFSVGGMLLFPAANDLLMMFVALEILSLPLYVLCGLARRRRLLSQEAAMKYFLLGAFGSGFFLYGSALLYGYAGSLTMDGIATAVSAGGTSETLLLAGTGLAAVGLLFKVSAVPFHAWTPDVYQGAPTPVTGFMAACTKVAAFGALLRLFYVGLGGAGWDWRPMIWAVAVLTMLVGSVLALTQTDVKRMLAYSSIAHAGFLLVGVTALNPAGIRGVLFYLLAYGLVTVGAFAVVPLVRDAAGEATHLSQWAGLGKRSPLLAGAFALFLLAFAGIPLTSGFTGKFAVFQAAIEGGQWVLVVVGVVASAIAAFFYVRVIVLMFFQEPAVDGPSVVVPSALTTVTIAVAVAGTVVLGVAPQPLLDLAGDAALFVR